MIKVIKVVTAVIIAIFLAIIIPVFIIATKYYAPVPLPNTYKDFAILECDLPAYANNKINVKDCESWCKEVEKELPPNIVEMLSKHWNIVIAPDDAVFRNDNITKEINNIKTQNAYLNTEMTVYGFTSFDEKIIYICPIACELEESFKFVLVHEIGHAISFYDTSFFTSDEWNDIYQKSIELYEPHCGFPFPEYASLNQSEMFATAFCDYIFYKENLKLYNPDIYNFVSNVETIPSSYSFFQQLSNSFNIIKKVLLR